MNCISWNSTASAKRNELHKLELPWFGATTCSFRTHQAGEKKVALNHLPYETKSKEQYLKKLCSKLKLENVHIKPRVNAGGGLALYWKNGIDLKVLDSTLTYIDAVVNPRIDDAWRLMGFYGNPITANREHS